MFQTSMTFATVASLYFRDKGQMPLHESVGFCFGGRRTVAGWESGLGDLPRLARWEGETEALQDGAAGDVAGEHDEWDAAARL